MAASLAGFDTCGKPGTRFCSGAMDARENWGKSLPMPAPLKAVVSVWVASMLALGCADKAAPEYVADQFADAYFRRMDQQAARQFTAFGATEMLDRELDLVNSVRAQGYTPEQAAAHVVLHRKSRAARGDRVRFDYDISIQHEEAEEHRSADVELAKIQSAWKVVRVDLKPRS